MGAATGVPLEAGFEQRGHWLPLAHIMEPTLRADNV